MIQPTRVGSFMHGDILCGETFSTLHTTKEKAQTETSSLRESCNIRGTNGKSHARRWDIIWRLYDDADEGVESTNVATSLLLISSAIFSQILWDGSFGC
mmetsp:Transcript_17537/g.25986  ORF Transcript_17537/g.25986 Transcript_17537/m.25986 type:complete len:99 (+) Transcript_17537:707-1003(+)